MPGYIGGAYDFSVDGEIGSATISFNFDQALLDNENFDPVIYYFNEDKQLLEELETTITGNKASAIVTHFSKYILLNRKVYESSFEWQDVWDTSGYSGVEVVLVIDDSGSMWSNDRANNRLTVARNLIDKLPENSKAGIVKFSNSASILTDTLTSDKETAKSFLTNSYFRSSGGTRMYSAIENSFSLFESSSDDILKMIVVLSDGETDDTNKHETVIIHANDNKVKLYTVGLGISSSRYFTEYLKPLANNTAGAFYLAEDASKLQDIYDDINKKIDIETDSDNDGIADYYEDHMVMFNGLTVTLDKNNPDTDGDGLSDGEEVAELNYQYNADRTQVIVTGRLLSNPLEQDTDGDGISDEEEMLIGTSPTLKDTDGDGLDDGTELANLYDPLNADPDNDGRLDLREFNEGTDPYTYNKEWYEHVGDFVYGFILGDFIEDTDSFAVIAGQITSGCIPYVGIVADARDVIGNLVHGDYLFAGLSAVGLVPAAGDIAKSAGKSAKFIGKNIDNVSKVTELIEFLEKNFPDITKALGKTDELADFAKKLSKADNIKLTRSQMRVITEAFDNAGLSHYLIKTSNKLDIKKTVDIGSDLWSNKAIKRGNIIDEFLNSHSTGKGLGKNFPVFDRLEGKTLVSTKSVDISAKSYQDPQKLKNLLNKYLSEANGFEGKYMKSDTFEWGKTKLYKENYDKKALEFVFPDSIMTEDTLKTLEEFKKTTEKSGVEVWYLIAK